MSDSLFLMQRYWGSDDSDAEEEKDSSSKPNQDTEFAQKRKQHTEIHDIDVVNDDSEPKGNDLDYVPKRKKKKKSYSMVEDAINADAEKCETDQHSFMSSADSTSEVTTKITDMSENSESAEQNDQHNSHELTLKKKKKRKKKKSPENAETTPESVSNTTEKDLESNNLSENSELFPVIKDVLNKQEIVVPRSLPDWLANPTIIKVNVNSKKKNVLDMDFLDETTKNTLTKLGIQHLFPVQFKVIPWLLQTYAKRLFVRPSDLCVSAPTGSGKTLAFVIPIVQSLKQKVTTEVRALVVLPVKELAAQVYKVFEAFCKGTGLTVVLIVGSKAFQLEQNALVRKCSRGLLCQVDIIVATPGRILDHINQTEGFSLKHLRYLVIDEADRMMEEIQKGWLKNIESAIYKAKATTDCCFSLENQFQKCSLGITSACSLAHVAEPVQKLFYSATLSQDPEKLHELSLYQPKLFTSIVKQNSLDTGKTTKEFVGKYVTPKGLVEKYVMCDTPVKPLVICHLLRTEKFHKVLCFTDTLEYSHRLHLVLTEMLSDLVIRELSSTLRVMQRKIILGQFASGKVNVLVCSDLMARGIDIENVDCVISYDAPRFIKSYIHRIGRTARAGKEGTAITLVGREELPKFRHMLKVGGKSLPSPLVVETEQLAPFQQSFKMALASASRIISSENKEIAYLKKGIKKRPGNIKNANTKHVKMNGH